MKARLSQRNRNCRLRLCALQQQRPTFVSNLAWIAFAAVFLSNSGQAQEKPVNNQLAIKRDALTIIDLKYYLKQSQTLFSGTAIDSRGNDWQSELVIDNGNLIRRSVWQLEPAVNTLRIDYRDGKKDGMEIVRRTDGSMVFMTQWKEGKRHGKTTSWYPNGVISFTGMRENGAVVGQDQCFDENADIDECDLYKMLPNQSVQKSPKYNKLPAADAFTGKQQGAYFYPEPQIWRIVDVMPVKGVEVPRDLLGLPLIMLYSDIIFTNRYISAKNINSGGRQVMAVCFDKYADGVRMHPQNRGSDKVTELGFNGRNLVWQPDKYFQLKLARIHTTPALEHTKRQLDLLYNTIIDNEGVGSADCKLEKIPVQLAVGKDFSVRLEKDGYTLNVQQGELDPMTPVALHNQSYLWTTKTFHPGDDLLTGGCLAEERLYQFATSRDDYHHFFLLGGIIGSIPVDGSPCQRITMLKRIPVRDITAPYTLMGSARISLPEFGRWVNDGELTLVFGDLTLLLSNIGTNQIEVQRVPSGY